MGITYGLEEMEYLKKKDSVLRALIDKRGVIAAGSDTLKAQNTGSVSESCVFTFLATNIIGQQLSNKAAACIVDRALKVVGSFTPDSLLNVGEEELRSCGISGRKISYIRKLSEDVKEGNYSLAGLEQMSDEEVITHLMKVKGVGRWTAEMTACFCLGRLNIFSYDDVALRNGILKAHRDFKTLSRHRFERLRKLYDPYCSVAALYYYAVNDGEIDPEP